MSRSVLKSAVSTVGPEDDGRPMSLADYEFVKVKPGYRYELSRGVIIVSDVPNTPTFFIEQEIHEQLTLYKVANSGIITAVSPGSSCKLLVNDFESERHPDLSIYKTLPRNGGRKVWRRWKPHIAIEVVSRSSRKRDYGEKREEYLALGIREYWIIDPLKKAMLALRRQRGQWREMKLAESDTYQTPLLPGFKLDLARVFAAGTAGR